ATSRGTVVTAYDKGAISLVALRIDSLRCRIWEAIGGTAEVERRAALTACEATDPKSASRCAADRGILFDKSFASPRVDRRWCWSFIILSSHAQIERRAGRHSRQEGRA